MGESRTYKLYTHPEEDNPPVKQALKRQNMDDMDAVYALVQDLLRGDTLASRQSQSLFECCNSPRLPKQ
eukprot:15174905-Ditylum_brightwellii.AAC.1